ncbi:MAG: glycosyltransferase [Bryobacteraceae bacterium]
MVHFGVICPPVSGHVNPLSALGRELKQRGHRVTFFHMPDLERKVRSEGLEFRAIGEKDHPQGSLPESLAQLGRLRGLAALRFTIRAIHHTTSMICRDAPSAVREEHVDALLVDQTEPAGAAIADLLGIPFITICSALALNRESSVPPPFTPWNYSESRWARLRNRIGYSASGLLLRPVTRCVIEHRKAWGLPHYPADASFSRLAQISQQPSAFDFPRRTLPPQFHYVGPLRNASPSEIPFPWERLDGRPLIYASLGSLQGNNFGLLRTFAEACAGLDAQLVISHGGGLTREAASGIGRSALVVDYAPQMELLAKASLTLTHAGLNTVLDSLTFGVPLVAIPITYEQPAIAARVQWTGTGIVIPKGRADVKTIRAAVQTALSDSSFKSNALRIAGSIREGGGASRAADLILASLSAKSHSK